MTHLDAMSSSMLSLVTNLQNTKPNSAASTSVIDMVSTLSVLSHQSCLLGKSILDIEVLNTISNTTNPASPEIFVGKPAVLPNLSELHEELQRTKSEQKAAERNEQRLYNNITILIALISMILALLNVS